MNQVDGGIGEGKTCNLFGRQSVKYPVKFDLKAIIDANIPSEKSINAIENIFGTFRVTFSNWRQKESSGGKYISYTVSVNIESQKMLQDIYAALRTIPGLKFAI